MFTKLQGAILFICVAVLLQGCGGGTSSGGSSQPTPPATTPSFTLALGSTSGSVVQGESTAPINLTITPQNGFNADVAVTVTGIGVSSGVSVSPENSFTIPKGTTSFPITFAAATTAAPGATTATFTATSGTLTQSASYTLTVTAESQASFQINDGTSSVQLNMTSGTSEAIPIAINSVGAGPTNYQVATTAAVTGNGMRATFSNGATTITLAPGQSDSLTVSVAEIVGAFQGGSVTVTATRTSDQIKRTLVGTIFVKVGGGSSLFVPETTGPNALPANVQATVAHDIADAVGPDGLSVCGSASGTRHTHIKYDPTAGSFFFSELTATQLPFIMTNADASYPFYDIALFHEFGNSRLNADLPNGDGTPLGSISEEMRIDPMAEFCSDVLRTTLVRSGTDTNQQVNSFFEQTLDFDALSHLDPITMAASRTNGQYDQLYQQAGGGFWKKLVGQSSIPTLKDYTEAYYAAENANGAFFTPAQFQTFLNTYQFDGMPAGDWAAQNLPLILAPPAPAAGSHFGGFFLFSNSPQAFEGIGFVTDSVGNATPVSSGLVTIDISTAAGVQAHPTITSDLGSILPTSPLQLNLNLPVGLYKATVSATVSGQVIPQVIAFMVVPPSAQGSLSQTQDGPFYLFAYLRDTNGTPVTGTITPGVDTDVVYPAGSANGGFIVVKPKAGNTTNTISLTNGNGKTYTRNFSAFGSVFTSIPVN